MIGKIPSQFFSQADEQEIVSAIQEAERHSSGEIRVHLACDVEGDIMEAAHAVFNRLKMHQTKDRNGMLILIELKNQRFALFGDEGIHRRVGQGFWNEIRDTIQYQFRHGNYLEGLLRGIERCGQNLKQHFPSMPDNANELSNEISRD